MQNKIVECLSDIGILKIEDNIAIKCSEKGLVESNIKRRKYSARYASEVMLEDRLPVGYIDKTVCGCGLTTVALENNYNTIIAVPSKNLLENKYNQYKNKENYHYELFIVKGGISKTDIDEYVKRAGTIKIMVTYDSLSKVEHLLDTVDSLVIDEAQELTNLIDLKTLDNKSSIDVISRLYTIAYKYRNKVSFITATPIPLEYEPDWISELDYHKIEWDNTIKVTPMLMKTTYPIKSLINKIVIPIKINGYANLIDSNNKEVKVKKAIVFINSISTMFTVCKKANLNVEDVGYIVGESLENDIRLGKYKRINDPKSLPILTFITSCGYSGIDLYDKEALTIIVSNIGKTYTMIDILTDLKQAASRQRDMSNPFINTYLYIYKVNPFGDGLESIKKLLESNKEEIIRASNKANQLIDTDTTKYLSNQLTTEQFKKEINTILKFKMGHQLLNKYSILTETKSSIQVVLNERLFMADKYRVEQTYSQYEKGFDIQGTLEGVNAELVSEIVLLSYQDLVKEIRKTSKKDIINKLDSYSSMYPDYVELIKKQIELGLTIDYNYNRANQNIETKQSPKIQNIIIDDIINTFKVGNTYPLTDIKEELIKLYSKHNLTNTPKATYLQEVFELVKASATIDNKRVNCYKILKLKNK